MKYKIKSSDKEKKIEVCSSKSIRAMVTDIYIKAFPNFNLASDDLKDTIVLNAFNVKIPEDTWDDRTLLDYEDDFLQIDYKQKQGWNIFCK